MSKRKNGSYRVLSREGHCIVGAFLGIVGFLGYFIPLCMIPFPVGVTIFLTIYEGIHMAGVVIGCMVCFMNIFDPLFSEDEFPFSYSTWQEWAIFFLFMPLVLLARLWGVLSEVLYEDEEED